jgi:hypothetical protein
MTFECMYPDKCSPNRPIFTLRHTTLGRTALDDGSARCRHLYLTTHNTHNRQTSNAPGGIRTCILSRRVASDIDLRQRGHLNIKFALTITSTWRPCELIRQKRRLASNYNRTCCAAVDLEVQVLLAARSKA